MCRFSALWSLSGLNWNGHFPELGGYPGWVPYRLQKWTRNLGHCWYGGKRYAMSLPCSETSNGEKRGGKCVYLMAVSITKIM